MRRTILIFTGLFFAMASTMLHAEEKTSLGMGNLALKMDYINFTDDSWSDEDDSGLYIGIEGYGQIMQSVYLGGEVGTATNIDLFGNDITFVPIELNIKYATEINPNIVLDFGAGASYNYAKVEVRRLFSDTEEEHDWLFGGQFFADFTLKFQSFLIGVNGKYQITEDFKDSDTDFNNWRLGGHIGIMF
jgi:hypothetical protein